MAFQFNLRQRVIVPGTSGVQGVVCARTDYARGESAYRVDHLAANGGEASAWHLESELLAANTATPPAAPVTKKRKAGR